MRPTKTYPFIIPANGSFPLLAIGAYFKVLSATGTFEVTGDTFGQLGALLPGQGLRDTQFTRLTFKDTSGAPNALQVLVADSTFVDDRITGEVAVIDGEKARTLAGGMYGAAINCNGGGAGVYSVSQLWNPAGSGKNLIVTQAQCSTNVAAAHTLYLQAATVARGTDVTSARVNNKMFGKLAGVAQARVENPAALPAVKPLWAIASGGTTIVGALWPIKGAVVVPPGFGVEAFTDALNGFVMPTFEWFEENQ